MKINVKNLIQVLDVNARCLKSRVIIPDFENILFEVSGETAYLTTRYDAMQVKCYLKIENDGDLCFQVEGSTFINTVKSIDTEHIDVELNDKTMIIKSGKSRYKIPVSSGEVYPKIKAGDIKEVSVTSEICRHISNASPFIDENDKRTGITGVHILTEGGNMHIMGTDSHCFYYGTIKSEDEMEAVTLHKSITGIIDIFKNSKDLKYGSNGKVAMIKDAGNEVLVSVLAHEFPYKALKTLVERKNEGKSSVFNTNDTSKSIRRALIYSPVQSHEVVLEFVGGEVIASAQDNATSKEAKEYVEASDVQLDDLRVAVNGQTLQRAMNGISSENVKVKIIDYNQPIYITDEHEEGDTLTIFMPILLKNK